MKFSIFVIVGIIGVAVANDTVYMTDAEKRECKNRRIPGTTITCCDYDDCPWCGFYERCCYKPAGGWEFGACHCGVNSFPQGTCY
jgi:hypothetical protein